MKRKVSIIYSWIIRSVLFFAPDLPFIMRFRGFLYGFMMLHKGKNFQVAHSVILNSISNLYVGDNVYIANNVVLFSAGSVHIESNVIIAPGVLISSNNHTYHPLSGFRFNPVDFESVQIGFGSWVCANAVLTKGSFLPPHSVLSPCSVLNRHVNHPKDSHGLYSGNPAKFIKTINQ